MVKRVEYAVCPLCGLNKVIESQSRVRQGKPALLQWVNFDVSKWDFVEVREGGGKTGTGKTGRGQGKGVGFYRVDGLTIHDVIKHGTVDQQNILAQMVTQAIKVIKEAKRVGLVKDADLK